jgi:hypothetical protein
MDFSPGDQKRPRIARKKIAIRLTQIMTVTIGFYI